MAKVFAIHYFDLKPGANASAFEKFIAADPFPTLSGWNTHIVKGERGERAGKYALIHEFDSVEIRNRYFPAEGGEPNPEVQQLFNSPEMQAAGEQWDAFATSMMQTVYTDYVVVG